MSVVQTFNVRSTDYTVLDPNSVHFTEQTLTETQKTQSATNIGIKNFSFTILSDATAWTTDTYSYSTQTIAVTGLKATYACTPWIAPVLSGTDKTSDTSIFEAFSGMGGCYITTTTDSLTIKITGDIPTVNIPCNLTVWG